MRKIRVTCVHLCAFNYMCVKKIVCLVKSFNDIRISDIHIQIEVIAEI